MSEKFKSLIEYFTKLPGIGPRQATRLILAMLEWRPADLGAFAASIGNLKEGPILCTRCFNFSDQTLCTICSNPRRNQLKIAVVERVTDLVSMERTGAFDGVYHVLGGAINPTNGMLPEKLKINELFDRVEQFSKTNESQSKAEVILATNPTTYGETTALFISEKLSAIGGSASGGKFLVTRLARGLPAGSTVEYTDELTLVQALKHRR